MIVAIIECMRPALNLTMHCHLNLRVLIVPGVAHMWGVSRVRLLTDIVKVLLLMTCM